MVEVRNEKTPEEAVNSHAPQQEKEPEDVTAKDVEAEEKEPVTEEKKPVAEETVPDGEDVSEEERDSAGEEQEQEQDWDSAREGDSEKSSKVKGFRKKPKKDKKDEKIEELNDRLMRNLAEFENFRNRSEKEKSARFDMGAKSVVEKILPVVDNLERGFDGLPEEERESPFVKGIEAVYKQLQTALEEIGVKPIEAVGQEFDPNLHNAVMHDEDDSEETNKVIEEFQRGYMYKDSVVRHSMVKVLN